MAGALPASDGTPLPGAFLVCGLTGHGLPYSAILALRLDEGLDLVAYESRFGAVARDRVDGALRGLEGTGLLVRRGENVALSDKGRFVANEVFIRLL